MRQLLLIIAPAAVLAGCVTVDERGRTVDRPRQAQPESLVVGRVAQGIHNLNAIDTNDNGILDTILVLVWLFPADRQYARPIWADGHLEFTLSERSGAVIQEWTFSDEETASSRADIGEVGRGHTIPLRLSAEVESRFAEGTVRADLHCRFVPAAGEPVEVAEPDGIVLGAVRRTAPGT